VKSSIVGGDRWKNIKNFGRRNFGRFSSENRDLCEVVRHEGILDRVGYRRHVAEIHAVWRKNPSIKVKRRRADRSNLGHPLG
jgi:hypothetical protein